MIPILYDKTETAFISNGLGRLRDCISCVVTEERNGIYECDFEYPITGAHYNEITLGRVVGVTHDDTGDIEPFDIVSYSKPIDGVVTFHCVHISYRLSYMTVAASNINSLADAFTAFESALLRMERSNRRLVAIIILLAVMLFGSNAAWIWYESQFTYIEVTQENDKGFNNFIGNDGDIYNGEADN